MKTLRSTGSSWWEIMPAKLTADEAETMKDGGDPEARSAALRNFEERSRRPAAPEDIKRAEELLRIHHQGEHTSATVILHTGHGQVQPKKGRQVRF